MPSFSGLSPFRRLGSRARGSQCQQRAKGEGRLGGETPSGENAREGETAPALLWAAQCCAHLCSPPVQGTAWLTHVRVEWHSAAQA